MNDEDMQRRIRRIDAACDAYRLNAAVNELIAAVDEIAAKNDSTKADVIRSAIEFIQAANWAKKDGKRAALAVTPEPPPAEDSVETRNLMGSLRATW